jgi:hypothetical protein
VPAFLAGDYFLTVLKVKIVKITFIPLDNQQLHTQLTAAHSHRTGDNNLRPFAAMLF